MTTTAMSMPTVTVVNASNIPTEALEAVRPHAILNGFGRSDAATLRFALIFARRALCGELLQGRDPGDETKGDA